MSNAQIHKYSIWRSARKTQHVVYFWKEDCSRISKIILANIDTQLTKQIHIYSIWQSARKTLHVVYFLKEDSVNYLCIVRVSSVHHQRLISASTVHHCSVFIAELSPVYCCLVLKPFCSVNIIITVMNPIFNILECLNNALLIKLFMGIMTQSVCNFRKIMLIYF